MDDKNRKINRNVLKTPCTNKVTLVCSNKKKDIPSGSSCYLKCHLIPQKHNLWPQNLLLRTWLMEFTRKFTQILPRINLTEIWSYKSVIYSKNDYDWIIFNKSSIVVRIVAESNKESFFLSLAKDTTKLPSTPNYHLRLLRTYIYPKPTKKDFPHFYYRLNY